LKENVYEYNHHPKTGKQQTTITDSVQDLCLMTREKKEKRESKEQKKATSKISEMMMLEKIIIRNTNVFFLNNSSAPHINM
jgi:hypothetical protein